MHYTVTHHTNAKKHAHVRVDASGTETAQYIDHSWLPSSRYVGRKHWVERFVALVLLLMALPVLLVLSAVIRLTSRGPSIYRQIRVGLHGCPFLMYKLRTMRQDAEAGKGALWCQPRDPRVTFVGRILRASHLDEIPQLINVVRGEMALIGPRPERPEFTQTLARDIPGYMQRHVVRPGITGLAQVQLPPDSNLESVRRKLVFDLEYARHGTLWLDSRILLATLFRLFGSRFGIAANLLGLRHTHTVTRPHRSEPDSRFDTERVHPK